MLTSRRTLPINYKKEDDHLFRHELIKHIPSHKTYCVTPILMSANGTFMTLHELDDTTSEKNPA